MVQKANTVFRDYVTDGIPSSGANDPNKADIRAMLTALENGVTGAAAGATIYDSKADMVADTSQAANAMAWVLGDPVAANNGVYQFDGTSTWTRLGDLPYSYITASNAGAGTANAIVATTSIPIPEADGAALIALPIVADNTSATVAVVFNGGSALTIKTNAGNAPTVGGLKAGMIVAGYVSGSTFRLLSDQASAAIQAAAEAAQAAAESAAASVDYLVVADRTALKAVDTGVHTAALDKEAGFPSPFIWRAGDYSSLVTADPYGGYVNKADAVAATAGAWLAADYDRLIVNPERFGAVNNSAVDNTDAFRRMAAYCDETGAAIDMPPWNILLRDQIVFNGSCTMFGAGRGKTRLGWDGSAVGSGLKVLFSDPLHRVNILNMDLVRLGATDGDAIHVDGSATVDPNFSNTIQPRNGSRGEIFNVAMKGATESGPQNGKDCWNVGVHSTSLIGLNITDTEFRGAYVTLQSHLGTAYKLDGDGLPVSIHIRGSTVYSAAICADILHHEGIYISDFEWVAVDTGLKWRTLGGAQKPQLLVYDGHMNTYLIGIDAIGIAQTCIHDVLFYRRPDAVADPHLHILLQDGLMNNVHDCTFSSSASLVSTDITFRNQSRSNIGRNVHQDGRTMINLDGNCFDTSIADQAGSVNGIGAPTYTNRIINGGLRTKYSGFSTVVNSTAAQSLANAIEAAISWGAKVHDSAASLEVWDPANPTRLVAHRTGVYDIAFNGAFASNATGYRRARLTKNGAGFVGSADISIPSAPTPVATSVSGTARGIPLNAGDYIELRCTQNSGGALDFSVNGTLSLTWVSD